ncbi:polysaccharide pyruvyl transferase family protein [Weissella confusa]|uniref:Exopolysaccharide pyruvyl transferase n=1 Tax=Limosilactobacillus reuteri TaxID=1598 RepID=A0A2T5Q1B6_LIMRT|nr:polysaccharide pyruvyl transferase family protein [Limosilactobacillus reuteri]MCW3764654.1 polysaccharide pyruvyl transferase family protein [Weissella confusa]PTV01204.1 exopolysaccharide pyruvyl transferase [Limosilactobacillus reuteri]
MSKFREKIKHALYSTNILFQKVPIKPKSKENRIFLFGTPLYMNYGDLAISLAEIQFMKEHFPSKEIITISEDVLYNQLATIKRIVNSTDIIALQGGGNMNDLYPLQDKQRADIIKKFKDNRIVLFPQSASYDLTDHNSSFYDIRNNILTRENVYLFFRDKYSTQFMKDNLYNKKVFSVPDIVLSLRVKNRDISRQNIITTFLRHDDEKLTSEKLNDLIKNERERYIIKSSDTVDQFWMEHAINKWNHEKLINKKLLEFQSSKLIITDRLHGMIFAIITGTPAIVFDNANHKIRNAYNSWLQHVPYIYYVDNKDKIKGIYAKIDKIMNQKPQTYKVPDFSDKYTELIKALS